MTEARDAQWPAMREAVLSAEEVAHLVNDLAAHATVKSVSVRAVSGSAAGPEPVTLGQVPALLASGAIRAVQVRYAYQEAEWVDTLMADGRGVRLIRLRQEIPT